jgi:hypothetical protein
LNKKIERIALGAFLVGTFIYQVGYGITTEQADNVGFSAVKADGLNAVYDEADTCDLSTLALTQHCNTGYDAGWKVICAIGVAKFGAADGNLRNDRKRTTT